MRNKLGDSCFYNFIQEAKMRHYIYRKCSKMSNTFLYLFLNKMLIIRAGIHRMLVRITNGEDPDQTAFDEAVGSRSALFVHV